MSEGSPETPIARLTLAGDLSIEVTHRELAAAGAYELVIRIQGLPTEREASPAQPWPIPLRDLGYWRRRAMANYAALRPGARDDAACRAYLGDLLGGTVKSRKDLSAEEWKRCSLLMEAERCGWTEAPQEQSAPALVIVPNDSASRLSGRDLEVPSLSSGGQSR